MKLNPSVRSDPTEIYDFIIRTGLSQNIQILCEKTINVAEHAQYSDDDEIRYGSLR